MTKTYFMKLPPSDACDLDGASSAKNRVLYKIEIENRANVTRAAKAADSLPEGMILLDTRVPFIQRVNRTHGSDISD